MKLTLNQHNWQAKGDLSVFSRVFFFFNCYQPLQFFYFIRLFTCYIFPCYDFVTSLQWFFIFFSPSRFLFIFKSAFNHLIVFETNLICDESFLVTMPDLPAGASSLLAAPAFPSCGGATPSRRILLRLASCCSSNRFQSPARVNEAVTSAKKEETLSFEPSTLGAVQTSRPTYPLDHDAPFFSQEFDYIIHFQNILNN